MPRPKLNPTDDQRRLVKLLAARGIQHEEIALMVNIRSPKTLRKFFREELDRGTTEAKANILGVLYKEAMAGNIPAIKLWMQFNMGWGNSSFERPRVQPPPLIVMREPEGGQV
jgi:hypothetical protein